MLKDDDGRWVTEVRSLEKMARDYYMRLYSMDDINQVVEKLPNVGFTILSSDETRALEAPFTETDIEVASRSMGGLKAPGPDGFQSIFYQQNWPLVGESVSRFVLQFFSTGSLPESTNDALIVLLPKVLKPEKITQFRPISLCNVLFKIITKTMVMRLKTVISKLIGPAQSSFIPGRLSTDNIVVVQEAVHSMRRKKRRKGWMLLKLDLEKAYDRIRWDFLEDTLQSTGLSEKWVKWIMACVSGPSMSLLWNGEKTDFFNPTRGLRQGDPLSPYLFVLCIERLCHLIDTSIANGEWKPIRLSRGGPKLSHICFADDLILFAEASVSQIRVIRRVLVRFCEASGQKISLEKSKIFFSENVSRDLGNMISAESGIGSTRELGKYLGMPILQKRLNKDTFKEILVRVSSRLAGWKGRVLSMAGRLTLSKVVLESIPVHSMSSIMLPASTWRKLDQTVKSFLWGSVLEKKKQHLVSWKKICKPKCDGGLGLRSAKEMNISLIAKLGWRILNDKHGLWAKVLRSKYKVGDIHEDEWLSSKRNWSVLWRSVITGLREIVKRGVGWVIGDGNTVKFWKDKWLVNEPLMEFVGEDAILANLEENVRSYWNNVTGWDLTRLNHILPESMMLRLRAMVIDVVTGARDRLSWFMNSNGEFSVKSAYALLTKGMEQGQCMESLFKSIWTVKVPERIRIFLWMVVSQVIMTNEERCRRHLCADGICQLCKGANESILHVLRDCPSMVGLWRKLVVPRKLRTFFERPLLDWMFYNLTDNTEHMESYWPVMFAITVWWGWKWRCGYVFGETGKCRDRISILKGLTTEIIKAYGAVNRDASGGVLAERSISWAKPETHWVKVNTDGASRGNPGLATAGGVIRDEDGRWCGGFVLNIGICSATLAELWGVYYGLYLAWEKGYRKVVLEVDSKMVVGFFQTGIGDSHPLSFLVHLCHGFISRDWIVRIVHVYREANRLADGLANYAFSLPLGFQFFRLIPEIVISIAEEDSSGSAYPRVIRL